MGYFMSESDARFCRRLGGCVCVLAIVGFVALCLLAWHIAPALAAACRAFWRAL